MYLRAQESRGIRPQQLPKIVEEIDGGSIQVIDLVRPDQKSKSLACIGQQSYTVSTVASMWYSHSVCDLGVFHFSSMLPLASTCRQIPSRAEHAQHPSSVSESVGGYVPLLEFLDSRYPDVMTDPIHLRDSAPVLQNIARGDAMCADLR